MAIPSSPASRRRSSRVLLALAAGVASVAACDPADSTSPEPEPPAQSNIAQEAVQGLVAEAMAGWWRSSHGYHPGPALSTAADAHTSSWRNWGMLDAGAEPRQPLNTDPEYGQNFTVPPWKELYRTLTAVAHALGAMDAGVELPSDEDTRRVRAMGRFLQGLALGQLAQLYDQAYVFDESTDLETVQLRPYTEVRAAALTRLGEAIELAEAGGFSVPAHWLAFHEDLTSDELARLARSFRARVAISVARNPAERAAVDWNAVLADVDQGVTRDWGGAWNGDVQDNWAWALDKLWAATHHAWARMDYRTIGPADASGRWQAWIQAPPTQREPFVIDTDDRRITDASGTGAGTYMAFHETTHFRPERGRDHFSFYVDTRWAHLMENEGVGFYPDLPVQELDFLRAEALHRTGDRAGAMALVNGFRSRGGLPAFTNPDGPAPGGSRCVPKREDGSCGDLWEALKYEKRIELFHYGAFTEYLDDRGWGDLVPGTFNDFPAPAVHLQSMVSEILGGLLPVAPDQTSPGTLLALQLAYEAYDRSRSQDPGEVSGG